MNELHRARNVIIREVADICSSDVIKWKRSYENGEDKYETKMNMKSEIAVCENIVFCTIKLADKELLSYLVDKLRKKFCSMGMKFIFAQDPEEDGLKGDVAFCKDIEEGINPVTCIGRINFAGMDMTVNVNLSNDESIKYANPDFKQYIDGGGICSEYNPENHVRRLGENDYVYLEVDDRRTVNEKWRNFVNAYYKVYGISLMHCTSTSINIKYDMKF